MATTGLIHLNHYLFASVTIPSHYQWRGLDTVQFDAYVCLDTHITYIYISVYICIYRYFIFLHVHICTCVTYQVVLSLHVWMVTSWSTHSVLLISPGKQTTAMFFIVQPSLDSWSSSTIQDTDLDHNQNKLGLHDNVDTTRSINLLTSSLQW